MNKSRLLYTLVIADVFLAFGSVGSEAFFGWTLPPGLQDYTRSRMSGFPSVGDALRLFMLAATVLCSFAAWIGLVGFWRHARGLYITACALDILLILISGPSVRPALSMAIVVMEALVGGAIIGLVYFSDLAQRFEHPTGVPEPANFGAHRV